jgi:Ni/Co efflux regulator RcnB
MRLMICSALAVSLLTGAAFGQTVDGAVASPTEDRGSAPASTPAIGAAQTRTDGGDKKLPDPHIYRLREHLSPAYGDFESVDDWAKRDLKQPANTQHWVRYRDNFLLVNNTDGLITQIVKAS